MTFSVPWWEHLKTKVATITGPAIIDDLRTKNVGVSANLGTNQPVNTGSEDRLEVNNTQHPYFDDFGELDATNYEIVLEHPSHHELLANAYVPTCQTAGEFWLRIYVNGVVRSLDHKDGKNGDELVLSTKVNLKLEAGDTVYATVEHNTGSTETFEGGTEGNYLSSIRL